MRRFAQSVLTKARNKIMRWVIDRMTHRLWWDDTWKDFAYGMNPEDFDELAYQMLRSFFSRH